MEINRKAPLVTKREILIQAPPEVVWRIHTDIDGWSRWNPGISQAKLGGPLAPGTVFRWKTRDLKITSTIREVEENRRIAWTGTAMGTRVVHVWDLEPQDDGVVLKTEESMEGWFVGLFKGMMRKTLDDSLNTWLVSLKIAAERASKEA